MRSAFTKWKTLASSGKYRRAKVVFPAPFGPAITMHRGRRRCARVIGLFIWPSCSPASNPPSGAMSRNRGPRLRIHWCNQPGFSGQWVFEPVSRRSTHADLRRRLTESHRPTLPHWPARSCATSSPDVARKSATRFGCAQRSLLRRAPHDARVAGRARLGGFRRSLHSALKCGSPGRVAHGYAAGASASARKNPAPSSRVRLQFLKVPCICCAIPARRITPLRAPPASLDARREIPRVQTDSHCSNW